MKFVDSAALILIFCPINILGLDILPWKRLGRLTVARNGDKGNLVRARGESGPYRQKPISRVKCVGNVKPGETRLCEYFNIIGQAISTHLACDLSVSSSSLPVEQASWEMCRIKQSSF